MIWQDGWQVVSLGSTLNLFSQHSPIHATQVASQLRHRDDVSGHVMRPPTSQNSSATSPLRMSVIIGELGTKLMKRKYY